jgi:hypothetical protein
VLKENRFEIQAVDADKIAAGRSDHKRDVFELIDELDRQRAGCAEMVMALGPGDMERSDLYGYS